jgi:salicylate hydroxylase
VTRPLRVSIVGAGLGGLAAAIALRQRGFEVTVFEQSAEITEIGAGVQLGPNAMKVLMALGLEQEAMKTAFEPERHVVRNWKTGRVVAATQMKGVYRDQFGAPYFGFHRADLQATLLQAVPQKDVRLNAKCVGVRNTGKSAVISFADGTEAESDVVVGADGIHSVVRESLYGPESPRFTGVVCWRGVVPVEVMPEGMVSPDMGAWFGPHSTLVTYYVRRGELINWAALYDAHDWREESWKTEGDPAEVMQTYKDWHPAVSELIAQTGRLYKWALFDREPLAQWSTGRITLLGDSAHPMLPYLAQGACMAVEDGYVLATELAREGVGVEKALENYEALRLPRTARVQLASRARTRVNQATSPIARLGRDLLYAAKKILNPAKHTYGVEWIYGHDVTAQGPSER